MAKKTIDFKFEEFAVQAIKIVDSVRSHGATSNEKPTESRINAFYRAIGLPTAVPVNADREDSSNTNPFIIDYKNNGNVFDAEKLNYDNYKLLFEKREAAFRLPITQEEVESFLHINERGLIDSLTSTNLRGANKRTKSRLRGVLFPMIVNGALPVFPQSRRISNAFPKNNVDDDIVYHRPLIEIIIAIRLKSEGVFNSVTQQKFANLTKKQRKILFNKTIQTLKNIRETIPEILAKVAHIINRARADSGIDVIPEIANIAQANLKTLQNSKRIGFLEAKKAALEEKVSLQQSRLALFESIDEISETANTENFIESAFTESIMGILVPVDSKTEKEIKETNEQISKNKVALKSAFRTLDLLLGTFSGISGIDVLVVITALFLIETRFLFGLLNTSTRKAIEEQKKITMPNKLPSVTDSIEALETKVKELLQSIESDAKKVKHSDKNQSKKE